MIERLNVNKAMPRKMHLFLCQMICSARAGRLVQSVLVRVDSMKRDRPSVIDSDSSPSSGSSSSDGENDDFVQTKPLLPLFRWEEDQLDDEMFTIRNSAQERIDSRLAEVPPFPLLLSVNL